MFLVLSGLRCDALPDDYYSGDHEALDILSIRDARLFSPPVSSSVKVTLQNVFPCAEMHLTFQPLAAVAGSGSSSSSPNRWRRMMRMTSHETDKSFSPSLATSLLLSFPALALLLSSQQHQPENV
ncbi:hypothetical protein THAR02_08357 [Trichoderma harzianum]|uniref:Uncharacterized protein n=1 Tax=Trichoderma harzianum TaxID=5544 RepID=A0A0G0A2R1_TRIHA|nr:hypothetical protein THAR02_08357 [Trichoderma harzianum]